MDLEANQTYYVKIWGGTIGGNYGLNLHKYSDAEGTSKYDAVPMQTNWEYTWSKEVDNDEDFGVFTAPVTGTYRMTFTNIEGGDLYAALCAFASDRQIGNRLNVYSRNSQKYTDCSLEAGVQYYVRITGYCDDSPKKYGILISNQPVTGIVLSAGSVMLGQGESCELQATVLPSNAMNKDVSWSSSNESVATVSSAGRVRTYGAGTAVITCTAKDGSGVSASCVVSVKPGKMSRPYVSACTTGSIRLKWDKVAGAKGYTVYQYNAKTRKWKALKSVKQTTYVVKKLKKATAYKFRVASYVLNGSSKVYGSMSDSLTAATSPGKTSVSVRQGGSYRSYYYRYRYITLRAKKIKGASGYQFVYSTSRNGNYYTLSTGKSSCRTSARTGQTFYFKVRAYKKAGGVYYYGAYSKPKRVKIKR